MPLLNTDEGIGGSHLLRKVPMRSCSPADPYPDLFGQAGLLRTMDQGLSQEEYIRQVLELYRKTPGTMGTVRRADRLLAGQLHKRGVSLKVIENGLLLAATRRLIRPADAPPLGTIRSLVYCLPVVEEVLDLRVSPNYFDYLRYKLARAGCTR